MSKNRRFSVSQEKSVNRLQKHVHGRLEHIKPRRVKIDGFKYGDETNTGPYAWQVTSPIKAVYQRKIAGYWKEAELFDIVYCVLILVLIDRESFDEDILIEIYRLLHGTAGRMHVLMEYNKALRATIQAIANVSYRGPQGRLVSVLISLNDTYRDIHVFLLFCSKT